MVWFIQRVSVEARCAQPVQSEEPGTLFSGHAVLSCFLLSPAWLMQEFQGDVVSENEPFLTPFVWTAPISQGRIRKVKMSVYADRTQRDAPVMRDDNVSLLSHVEADISHIPENLLGRRKGVDGQVGRRGPNPRGRSMADHGKWYYDLSFKIEAVCKWPDFGDTSSEPTPCKTSDLATAQCTPL